MNNNIDLYKCRVTQLNRAGKLNQAPYTLWFTGPSGSGKSTIANELDKKLINLKKSTYLIDGDNIRHGLNSDLGFTDEDRKENIRRIAEVAALFTDAGLIVLIAAISPTKEMRGFARSRLKEQFIEIYVKADISTCINRDPKGLYRKALANEIPNFTGISAPYEPPENPEIILDTEAMNITECTEKVLTYLKERGGLSNFECKTVIGKISGTEYTPT